MKVAGIIEESKDHHPGVISYVIFTRGCNFKCHYCYNSPSARYFDPDDQSDDKIDDILTFLENNKEKYGAVVVSGGEPTMHDDLPDVLTKIKSLDLFVRLETNGTYPKMLSKIVSQDLADYIALDIKAPLETGKYKDIAGVTISTSQLGKINKSIRILTRSKVEYEIRTTLIKQKHDFHDILDICNTIVGCKRYCLQEFDAEIAHDKTYNKFSTYTPKELERMIKAINPEIKEVIFKE
jgi:pyruvate formate lyase activating enzyme